MSTSPSTPSDREAGTLWGEAAVANLLPTLLGHFTSAQSWLSQWSVRTSNGNGRERLTRTSVPVHVIYGTADQACFPEDARQLYDGVPHDGKKISAVTGGRHYLNGQPELTDVMADIQIVGRTRRPASRHLGQEAGPRPRRSGRRRW